MVGDKDVFECFECGYKIVTVEKDQGRPPYVLPCLKGGCDGVMRTHFNNKVKAGGKTPDYELRFPTDEEYEQIGVSFQEKVDRGNLLPFKIEDQSGRPDETIAESIRRKIS